MENRKHNCKRIGFWLNEKKCKKFDLPKFIEECRKFNMDVIRMDLQQPLEPQGPFDLILHKMTAIYAQALSGNLEARMLALKFEQYLRSVPNIPVVDPVPGVHTLLHRPATYAFLDALTRLDAQVLTPPYVELPDTDIHTKKKLLTKAGVTFPIVCKPVFGCGGTAAHELAVVLSASRLTEWRGPCVAQSFVPHGAVLYKLYVLGDLWHLVVRPSLKNFRATDAPTVHFNSAKVSKAGSCSPLTKLDQRDQQTTPPKPDDAIFDRIVRIVRSSIGMDLLGIDVVIDSCSGRYAIIDVNPFPSDHAERRVEERARQRRSPRPQPIRQRLPAAAGLVTRSEGYDSFNDLMPRLAQLLRDKVDSIDSTSSLGNDNAPASVAQQPTSSSISDLLPPLERTETGEMYTRRTDDSGDIDVFRLLKARGHLTDGRESPATLLKEENPRNEFGSRKMAAQNGERNSSTERDCKGIDQQVIRCTEQMTINGNGVGNVTNGKVVLADVALDDKTSTDTHAIIKNNGITTVTTNGIANLLATDSASNGLNGQNVNEWDISLKHDHFLNGCNKKRTRQCPHCGVALVFLKSSSGEATTDRKSGHVCEVQNNQDTETPGCECSRWRSSSERLPQTGPSFNSCGFECSCSTSGCQATNGSISSKCVSSELNGGTSVPPGQPSEPSALKLG